MPRWKWDCLISRRHVATKPLQLSGRWRYIFPTNGHFFFTPNFPGRSQQWHCAYRTHGAIYQQPHEGAKVSRLRCVSGKSKVEDRWRPVGTTWAYERRCRVGDTVAMGSTHNEEQVDIWQHIRKRVCVGPLAECKKLSDVCSRSWGFWWIKNYSYVQWLGYGTDSAGFEYRQGRGIGLVSKCSDPPWLHLDSYSTVIDVLSGVNSTGQ